MFKLKIWQVFNLIIFRLFAFTSCQITTTPSVNTWNDLDYDADINILPANSQNVFEKFGYNLQTIAHRLRTRAKDTLDRLHLGTSVVHMDVVNAEPSPMRPLQKFRERLKLRRIQTTSSTARTTMLSSSTITTTEVPLEYYGALSSKFQNNFTKTNKADNLKPSTINDTLTTNINTAMDRTFEANKEQNDLLVDYV